MRTLGDDELAQFRSFQQAQSAFQQAQAGFQQAQAGFQQAQAATQQQHQQQYPYAPQQTAAYQPVQAYSPASTAVPIYASTGSG